MAAVRITPAHAGKSFYAPGLAAGGGDHPRTRGEKNQYPYAMTGYQGSPPHTRGKVPFPGKQPW